MSQLDINITSEIGPWGYDFQQLLADAKGYKGKKMRVVVNSYGGSVLDALAMYNFLRGHQAEVETHIPAYAMSAGTVIAAAGDHVTMAENGFYMIHNPWSVAIGESGDMQHTADILDKMKAEMVDIYYNKAKRKVGKKEIARMMDAETWMTAQEALAAGFVDELTPGAQINASFDPEKLKVFNRVPEAFRALVKTADAKDPQTTVQMNILDKIKAFLGLQATANDTEVEQLLGHHKSLGDYRDSIAAEVRAEMQGAHDTAMAALQAQLDTASASLATANATVATQASTITDLQGQVTTLTADVAALKQQPAAERGAGKREEEGEVQKLTAMTQKALANQPKTSGLPKW